MTLPSHRTPLKLVAAISLSKQVRSVISRGSNEVNAGILVSKYGTSMNVKFGFCGHDVEITFSEISTDAVDPTSGENT
jgi:hypothetical protein